MSKYLNVKEVSVLKYVLWSWQKHVLYSGMLAWVRTLRFSVFLQRQKTWLLKTNLFLFLSDFPVPKMTLSVLCGPSASPQCSLGSFYLWVIGSLGKYSEVWEPQSHSNLKGRYNELVILEVNSSSDIPWWSFWDWSLNYVRFEWILICAVYRWDVLSRKKHVLWEFLNKVVGTGNVL